MHRPAWRRRTVLPLGLAVSALAITVAGGTAGADGPPVEDRARGVVWAGVQRDDTGACHGAFRLSGTGDGTACTHGPDPAEDGVDVTRARSTDELAAATNEGSSPASAGTVPCYGDGSSGKRVQAVYAYAEDVPNRAAELVDLVAGWAGAVDKVFNDSAAKTSGIRHVRWVTADGCRLSVMVVRMAATGDDSFSNTVNELKAAGLTRTDRKYLAWVDKNLYCGISQFRSDDSAGSANANESGPGYARVDTGCWGLNSSVEAHELMHMIGGVQHSAPHSTGAGHCTDEQDRMCYTDSQSVVLTYVCPWEHERLFDCGDDDYFHTGPAAGSYLATHWNAATSTFLERAEPSATTEPPSDPSPASTSTTSTSWSGSTSRKATSIARALTTGSGTFTATLTFSSSSKSKSLTLTLKRADGTVVAEKTGPSPLSLAAPVSSGTQSVVVSSGGASASFTVSAVYPTP